MHNHNDADLLAGLLPAPLARVLQQPDPPAGALDEGRGLLLQLLHDMAPFVPSPALDLHMAQPERGRIAGLNLHGTTLLITVANFSALSSQLTARGLRGTEELSAEVARIAELVLRAVHERGGGLVKFGGDSFTAFFDRSRLGRGHAAQACAAGLELCRRAAALYGQPAEAGASLWLSVSAHSGMVFAAEVGDAQQTELIVTGRAVNRVVRQLSLAGQNQLVVSDTTLRELDQPRARALDDTSYQLEALAETPPRPAARDPLEGADAPGVEGVGALLARIRALRPYVRDGLSQRLRAGATEGEFRPVTVLFARFYAFSRLLRLLELSALIEGDSTIIGRMLNAYYSHASAAVRRYGGSIHRVDMATFGDRLMAVFGAPSGHEDDPARAVHAALALEPALEEARNDIRALIAGWPSTHPYQQAFTSLGVGSLRQRVGVATGTVFAGLVGSAQRREYTVLGEAVGQAARLLAAANDRDLLLAAATQGATRGQFVAQPVALPSRFADGLGGEIFRVLGPAIAAPPRAGAHATPLIGRRAELAQLRAIAEAALAHSESAGRVVSIVGEAGSGKSRLADEALRQLPARSLVLRERCQSYEQSVPYATIVRLLRQLLELGAVDGPVAQAAYLDSRVAQLVPERARFAPLLGALLGLPLAQTELTQALGPERRQERLHELIAHLFLAVAAQRPLVLLVDDLQWADPSSHALVASLAEALAGQALLLLVYRPGGSVAEPWRDLPHHSAIVLENLGPGDSAALLAALLGSAPPPQLHALLDQAHGLPLFLEQLVGYLCESGQLRRGGAGGWSYHAPSDGAVPMQIEQIVVARLDRLDPDTHGLLQVAAVLGQHFSRQLLAAVAGDADARLAALLDAALLVAGDGREPSYRFRHTLVREVVYAHMLFAQRRALHRRAAAAIERLYAAAIEHHRVVLAHHYRSSGQFERAYEQLVLAARDAQQRYANHEARALYEEARALAPWRARAPDPAERAQAADLIESSGDVRARLNDNAGARDCYEMLLALLAPLAEDEWALRRAATQRKIGGTYEHQGNMDTAMVWCVRALDTLAPLETPAAALERARLRSDVGWLFFRRNELAPAQRELEAALELTGALAAYDLAAQIYNRLGGIAWTQGDLVTAQHYVEQRLLSSQQAADLAGQASAYNNLGIIAETQGRQSDALAYSQQALAISEQIGNGREAAIAANTSGMALYSIGQAEQARRAFAQAHERATAARDTYVQMLALLNMSRALVSLRQWDAAERTARQSQFIAAQMSLPAIQLEGQTVLVEAALDRGDLARAGLEYQAGHSLNAGESEEYARFLRAGARIAHAQGDDEQCELLLCEAEARFEQLQNAPEIERTRALRAAMGLACASGAARSV